MRNVTSVLNAFAREEEGATMVEYGIMVALIAVVCIGAVITLGGSVNGVFNTINSKLTAALPAA